MDHGRPAQAWRRHHTTRLLVSAAIGLAAGSASVALPLGGWFVHVLFGITVAMLVAAGWTLRLILALDGSGTAEHLDGVDGSRTQVELVGQVAAAASLVGVGVLLTTAQGDPWAGVVSLATVAAGWLTVHTTATLSYARHWVTAEPGCIEFSGCEAGTGRSRRCPSSGTSPSPWA